ncbi:ABC transporter substrate-binding protein [Aeromicrobium sp. CF4.19]|uniref:ABC transporter substrate-binding protein n=1 Tax=Aeromicrobium sp. CF4.19 TaxID=3373082 RepID=UPI003EE7F332
MSRMRPLVGLVAGAALALAACGTTSPESGGDAWTYESGDGKTHTADEVPSRIIAQADAAAALISNGIRPVGIFLSQPLDETKSLSGLDLEGIEIVGETWGKIDGEKAASLDPDLIVSGYWEVEEAYGGLEESVDAETKKVADLAPVVGPAVEDSVVSMLEGFEELAVSLGADVDAPDVAEGKAAFEKAKQRFQETVAANEGLTALGVSPADDLLYVAVPENSAELSDFTDWGLDVIVPDAPDPSFPYWENLSWEQADKYQPDLVLMDDRTYDSSLRTAEKQPTWDQIDAAESGAIVPWPAFWISTYAAYADQLDQLSDAIDEADPGLT